MPINPADLAPLPPGASRRQRPAWFTEITQDEPVSEQSSGPRWYDTAASTALRVIPSIAGTAIGAVAAAPTGPGAVAGGVAGGGAGSALGEWLAQQYEQARGIRSGDTDWSAVATEGVIGALPLDELYTGAKLVRGGMAARDAYRAIPKALEAIAPRIGTGIVRGAAQGSVGEAIRQGVEEGEAPDLSRVLMGGLYGGAFGGAGAGLIKGYRRYRTKAAQPPPAPAKPPFEGIVEPNAHPFGTRTPDYTDPYPDLMEILGSPAESTTPSRIVPGRRGEGLIPEAEETYVNRTVQPPPPMPPAVSQFGTGADNAGARPAGVDAGPDPDAAAVPRQEGPGLFDDAARPQPGRFGDESGQVSTQVATSIAGAGVGAVAGGALPGTPEERRDRALGFGFAGALAGAGLGSRLDRAPRVPAGAPDLSKAPVNAQTRSVTGGNAPRGDRVWRMTDWQPLEKAGKLPKDRIDSFNLGTFSPNVQREVHNLLVENMGYEVQRRGVQSRAATFARAQRVAVNLTRMVKPGTAVNAEGQVAYGSALLNLGEKQHTLAKKIAADEAAGVINAEDQKAWLQTIADLSVIVPSWAGIGSESGRGLHARRFVNNLLPAQIRVILAAEKENPLSAQLRAAMIATNDPIAAVKLWQAQQQKGGFAKYIMTNMLSGIQTQERNFLGTLAATATRLVTKPLATVPYDALRAALTGKPREVYAQEVREDLKGLLAGIQPAISDAAHVLRYGFSERALQDALEEGATLKLPGREFAGGGANPMNWVGRGMAASDRWFYTLNQSADTRSRTYAAARKIVDATTVKPGTAEHDAAMAKTMANLIANPTKELQQAIDKAARESTLTSDPGIIARKIGEAKHAHPSLNFLIAFERTVSNALRLGYEYSPASLAVKGARRASGKADAFGANAREEAEMVGKGIVGTMAMMPLAYLASTGRLTGDGPRDPAKRAQLMESGWRPHSIKVPLPDWAATALNADRSKDGEYFVNYQLAQPIALPAAVMANAFEAWAEETQRQAGSTQPRSPARFATEVITRSGRSVLSQSFLTGMTDIMAALDEGGASGTKAIENIVRTFVPLQGALRNVQRMTDPIVRQPQGFGDNLKAGIPGLSQTVEPMISRYGEPVRRSGGAFRRGLAVPEIEPQRRDWIDDELNRLDIQIDRPSDRLEVRSPLTGELYRLTPAQTSAIREARGKAARAELSMVMGMPGYADLPDEIKRTLIARARAQAQRDARSASEFAVSTNDLQALRDLLAPQRQIAKESYR